MTERLADVSDMEKGRGGIIAAAILPRFNVHTTRNGQRSGRASEGGREGSVLPHNACTARRMEQCRVQVSDREEGVREEGGSE